MTRQEKLNSVFGALSDPTRRKILERLARQDEISVSELAKPFQMTLPAISRHLRVLEDARLVNRTRSGRVHHIRANEQGIHEAQRWIAQYAKGWELRFGMMDELLKQRVQQKRKEQKG